MTMPIGRHVAPIRLQMSVIIVKEG